MPTLPAKITGVFSAAATPLLPDGRIDHVHFAQHCRLLFEEGCDGIALLGTTGEANSFSAGERSEMLEQAVANGIDPARLLPGTAHTSLTETITQTRHAVSVGAAAVLLLPPFYYKDVSEEGLYRYFSQVIEGVGSDSLCIVLYHIPQVSGVAIPHGLIARLLAAYPKAVVGIKDSSGDMANMQAMIDAFPGFSVLAGSDRQLLPVLRAGGAGCITASSNLIARELRFVFNNWNAATEAGPIERAQDRIEQWRNLVISYPQTAAIKVMLARRRGHDGWTTVRPPIVELAAAERAAVLIEMVRLEALR
jgi:4-hydroxy-tetrahydrodipicolinate synthase